MVNGSTEKQSTEVKSQNVEGDGVGDPSKQQMERRSESELLPRILGSGATENAQPQAGASARRPFRLKVGTKMA